MKRTFVLIAFAVELTMALTLFSCGPARRDEPYTQPLSLDDPHVMNGQRIYMTNCNQCHPAGAAGLAPGLNDKPLTVWAMKLQVRHGVGAMPAFKHDKLSDADLADLIRYEKALRTLR
jgi:mono/diheme cytochrome c family protein